MIIVASSDPKWHPQVLEFKKEAADNEEKLEFYCKMSQDPRSPNVCPLFQGVGWELARQKNHKVTKKKTQIGVIKLAAWNILPKFARIPDKHPLKFDRIRDKSYNIKVPP